MTALSVTTPEAKLAKRSPLWLKPRAGPLPYGADFALTAAGNFSAVEGLILASILQRCRQVSPFVGLDEGGRGV